MSSPELIGHEDVLAGLWTAAGAGRLPHALLLHGPRGVGKYRAALRLAAGLLCEAGPGPPCERCPACARGRAGSQADLFVLDPTAEELETIPIWRVTPRHDHPGVETVEAFLSLRAREGGWRVVCLRDFDRAHAAAQNALLKILEEPGEATLLVLESSRPRQLLETIRSRCVAVRLEAVGVEATAELLADAGVERADALRLARWSEGAPGRAHELLREGALETVELLSGVLDGRIAPLTASARLQEAGGEFPGATDAARARSKARAAVVCALELARDLQRFEHGVEPADLAHGAALAARGRVGARPVARAVDALLRARQDVEANLSPPGILDRTALALARVNAARRGTTEGVAR
ncbi:MAG: hypothetical protein QF903_04590 [Planctomycetota bacterium]|nr:hypothetical protein [Planctomycetota bacterium]MDP6762858.1 hypothetical protein [Planctomycetota bacterium]MDP6988736.1 hypothetical protein [Planctomycetota bacterium]